MIALKDVAKLAKVSLMTVSRAINFPEQLKPETLIRVQKAIQDTGYVPDLSAKKIRNMGTKQGTHTLGVLALDTTTSPFSVEITLSIEETARGKGWHSFVVNTLEDDDPEKIISLLLSHRPDGVIYTTTGLREVQIPKRLQQWPLVLANCESPHTKIASYIPDDDTGQYDAVSALLSSGYRKPLFLHLPKQHPATIRRLKGLERACIEKNINPGNLYHYFLPDGDGSYLSMTQILQRHLQYPTRDFDSVVCGNDRIAFIVYQIIFACGLKIPRDIAVIGYDNMVGIGDLFIPALSTVQLPHYEMGRQSALHIIEGKSHKDTIFINAPWLQRASV